MALAQAGAVGVDATYAALILGRVELATSGRVGADRLQSILSEQLAHVPPDESYLAATQLGVWAFREQHFDLAEFAWSTAANYAAAAPVGGPVGRAISMTWQGSSIYYRELGTRGDRRIDSERARAAIALLTQAQEALRPLAPNWSPDAEPDLAMRSLAEALAVQGALRAELRSVGQPVPEGNELVEIGPMARSPIPRCSTTLAIRAGQLYPQDALEHGLMAGLAMLVHVNSDGDIVSARTIARAGDEVFARALESRFPQWHFARQDDSLAECRMESTILIGFAFSVRS